ncbi:MAG: choice-of-anchor D domain-containing protein [Bacteroidia bacterium]|nr:choice-of-anchor D domain-containing protein [Bacteroidia bacterium]
MKWNLPIKASQMLRRSLLLLTLSLLSYNIMLAQNGLNFNGSGGSFTEDHVAVPHSTTLNLTELTFETWVYWTGGGLSNLFMKTGNSGIGDYGYGVAITGNGYLKWWQVYDGSKGPFSTGTAISKNTWTHVAVTVKDGGSLLFYINGTLVGTDMAGFSTAEIENGTKDLIIGKQGPHDNYFQGTMDEFRIWNVVRSASEISNNMNTELAGSESGLVLYYKFNQGTASGNNTGLLKVCDLTANGNSGTIKGFNGLSGGGTANWVAVKSLTGTSSNLPEINVKGNGANISNNDSIPTLTDSTNFGNTGTLIKRRFTIENTGDATLVISKMEFKGNNASDFTIENAPASIAGGNSATFTVVFSSNTPGIKTAILNIYNNDCDEGVYNFRITKMYRGEALHFSGGQGQNSNFDYVSIPDNGSLDLGNTFTIESWVYLDDSANNTIVDKGDYRYLFQTHPFPGYGLGFYNQNISGNWVFSTGKVPIKEWCHVAVSFSTVTGKIVFYLNGNVLSTHTGAVNGGQDNGDINIGRQQPSGSFNFGPCQCNMFNGKMDELRIWGVALDSCDIRNRMFGEVPTTASGLLANFHFNQGDANNANSTATLVDASGNNNNGTLQNFTLSKDTSNWVQGGGVASDISFVYTEAMIKGNSTEIANMDMTPSVADSTDFGSVIAATMRKYSIENTGTDTLWISSIVLGGTNAVEFSLQNLPTYVLPASTATFNVQFNPVSAGQKNATITVTSDDCDEANYTFAVAATGDFSSINPLQQQAIYRVYPNPASGDITISIVGGSANNTVEISNILGAKIISKNMIQGVETIDISGLLPGIYTVKISSDAGAYSQKIVVE